MLDTNILVYAITENSSYNKVASDIIRNANHALFITTKVITEFFAVCSKLRVHEAAVFTMYYELLRDATILYPNASSLMHFETLLKKYHPKGNRVFDMEIVSVMMANDINTIATYNRADFKDINEIALLSS